jgi:hydrogenase maturation protease
MDTRDRGALVVCIGNELVADDAVGHEVFQVLQAGDLPPGTRLEFVGVGGIALLDLLNGSEGALVVVDAVQFGSRPGTLHRLTWDEIPAYGNAAISAHGIGLREAIEVGTALCPDKLPPVITLFGIEGRCFNRTREYMTPDVAAVISEVVAAIRKELIQLYEGI